MSVVYDYVILSSGGLSANLLRQYPSIENIGDVADKVFADNSQDALYRPEQYIVGTVIKVNVEYVQAPVKADVIAPTLDTITVDTTDYSAAQG